MRRLLAALLLSVLAACAGIEHKAAPTSDDLERQLLVMVEAPPHYRPGAGFISSYVGQADRTRFASLARTLAREHGVALVDDWPMGALGLHCFVVQVAPGASRDELSARLAADPRVESVQAMQVFRALARNDPYYGLQSSARELRLDQLHRSATGRGVRIAQIDTGADLHHPDLQGQFGEARNFVAGTRYAGELHGTAVAGVIAARADNELGMVGVAPGATLLPLRACWPDAAGGLSALCSSFTLASAIQFALDQRARIINLSITGPRDRLLERLLERAAERGLTLVGAVDPASPQQGFPASHPRVIAVAALGDARLPDGAVIAPGEQVLTTVPGGGFGFFSGSSFAAAHVSAVSALLLEMQPGLSGEEVRTALQSSKARHVAASLDACAALARVARSLACACCEETLTPALSRPRERE